MSVFLLVRLALRRVEVVVLVVRLVRSEITHGHHARLAAPVRVVATLRQLPIQIDTHTHTPSLRHVTLPGEKRDRQWTTIDTYR